MISSGDFEKYQKLYSAYGEDEICLEDIESGLGIGRNYSKVFIHRLGRALGAVQVERGKYILVAPEVWMELYLNMGKYPFSRELLKRIGRDIGNIEMMAVYGSWVRGEEKKDSDVDVFIVHRGKAKKDAMNGGRINIEYSTPESFLEELKSDPLFIYSVLEEGDAIIGRELKMFFSSLGHDIGKLQEKVAESIAAVRAAKRLLKEALSKSTMETACYVATLRLRTGFIAKSVVTGTPLSHRSLRKDFFRYFKKKKGFDRIFDVYAAVRGDRSSGGNIELPLLEEYLNSVEDYLSDTWSWLEDAKKKEAG